MATSESAVVHLWTHLLVCMDVRLRSYGRNNHPGNRVDNLLDTGDHMVGMVVPGGNAVAIDFDEIMMSVMRSQTAKCQCEEGAEWGKVGRSVVALIAEVRRLQEVERKYDQFLQDTLDVTAAVMREFPGSKLKSSEVRE